MNTSNQNILPKVRLSGRQDRQTTKQLKIILVELMLIFMKYDILGQYVKGTKLLLYHYHRRLVL